MLKKRFQINIQYAMILCLLFLAAINFDAKFFYFAFGAAIVTMFFLRRIKMNAVSVVYLALGLLMGAFHASLDLMSALRPLAFFLVYLVGYNIPRSFLARKDGKKEQDVTYQLLVTVALGSFAHLMLNFLLNMGNDLDRNTVDIWSGEIMAATGQAALGCIMMGLGAAMVIQPDKKRSRLFGVIVIAGMLLYNLALAGRTLLVILLICLAVGSLYAAAKSGRSTTKRLKIVIRISILALVLLTAYLLNIGGVRGFVEDSNLYQRFFEDAELGISETGRWANRVLYLKKMLEYPFGGLHMRERFGYAHDLLLDAYDEFGILALLLLLLAVADGCRQLYLFCKNEDHKLSYRVALLCCYTAILLEFCVEPIFAGMPWLFVCYSLINAALACTNRAAKVERQRMMDQ